MRYPGAIWRAGAPGKFYEEPNPGFGAVMHSAEGYMPGIFSVLDFGAESWPFTVAKDGRVYQHYDLDRSCFHAGNRAMNTQLVGIEHEGKAGEPLTEAQFEASLALVRWLSDALNWHGLDGRLFEHNVVVGWGTPNAGPTACPSGRIPFQRYLEAAAPVATPITEPSADEEEDVQTRPLDQGQSIQLIEVINRSAGGWISDSDGGAWEVTSPLPGKLGHGQRAFLVVVDADRVSGVG